MTSISTQQNPRNRLITSVVQASVATMGIVNLITGLALVFTPQWFFTNIGYFPPYNRHYAGDLGTFLIPLGIGLLWASRRPAKHQAIIVAAALSNIFHAGNHLYDDLIVGQMPSGQTILLIAVGLIFLLAVWQNRLDAIK